MVAEYLPAALRRARYELIEDEEPYYGEVRGLLGVWATGQTLEECRERLAEVIEGWLLIRRRQELAIPRLLQQAGITRREWLATT